MRSDEHRLQPVVVVPEECKQLESDFQRMLYVENRIAQLSTLKHDRLMLKERFLQALVPPEVQLGFSERINELVLLNEQLNSRLQTLTSKVDRLKQEQITVVTEEKCDNDMPHRECEDIDSNCFPPKAPTKRLWFVLIVLAFVLLYGWTHGISCSPSSVESDPVGVEHSMKGGTTNGVKHQPNKGPSPPGKGNRRLP